LIAYRSAWEEAIEAAEKYNERTYLSPIWSTPGR
jgi:hypothetical protein